MSEQQNKQAVARLFEAFRTGDTDAFADLIGEDYVQHHPQALDGLEPMQAIFAAMGPVDVEVHRMLADGDLVAAHVHYKAWNTAGVDIYRFDDEGKIVEHWDVLQQIPRYPANDNGMF